MGIVVTVAMLLGLIILRPTPWRSDAKDKPSLKLVTIAVASLAILGAWNFLWFGLRHLAEFWGWAAIVSGLSMIFASLIIFAQCSEQTTLLTSNLVKIKGIVTSILALSFVVYSVTLIQLNLGLPIIGR